VKRRTHTRLEDIARRLGVSRVTVSKALRGHPDISQEMTARVRKAADEMGYIPNIMARSLSSRRSGMVGLVVPKIAHFFFGSVIEGVYNTAFESNYETILTVSQENPGRELKHLRTLASMRVDGIIISITQTTTDLSIFSSIQKSGVPVLFLDRCPEPPLHGFNSVTVDDAGGAYKAVEQAIKMGYQRIACVGGGTHINIGKHRLAGFEAALKHHGIPLQKEWVVTGGFGKNVGYDGFMQFYASKKIPEFIFAMTYPIALGIYEAAKEVGMKIPDDLDLICFGDSDVSRILSPALSCVTQPAYELGSKAFDLMLMTISHPDTAGEQHVVLSTELLLRETCTGKNTIASAMERSATPVPVALREASQKT
jgi:LacI family transcriptional regulator